MLEGLKLCCKANESALLMLDLSVADRLLDEKTGSKCTAPAGPATSTTIFVPAAEVTGFTPKEVTMSPRINGARGSVASSGR